MSSLLWNGLAFSEHGTEGLNPQEAVMVVESVCQNRQGVQLAWNFFKAALWICKNLFPDPFFWKDQYSISRGQPLIKGK
jgi:hypothetical protein